MTLSELVAILELNEQVSIPSSIADLEIENAEAFCRRAELNYLKSVDFKDDLIDILNSLVETSIPLIDFSLLFVKESCENLKLKATCEIEESL